jgi:hypothetical protein
MSRDEQHEQEPQRLGEAAQVMAAEDVDEHRDKDPDPDDPQKENEHRPEKVQYHFCSFAPGRIWAGGAAGSLFSPVLG